MLSLRVASLADTHAIAAAIAALARPGDMIVLAGEMGAGKTAFAQGFGRSLGIVEPITSPTFTLVHSYPLGDRRTLHHADLYRLDSTADVADLALDELAEFGGIVLIEWGDVVSGFGDHLEVRLSANFDDELENEPDGGDVAAGSVARDIEITATGTSWAGRWDRLASALARWRA